MDYSFKEEISIFRQKYPDTECLHILYPDMNGIIRMKETDIAALDKLAAGKFYLSSSLSYLSTTGETIPPIMDELGADPDRLCVAVPATLKPVPWAKIPTAQVMVTMRSLDGGVWHAECRDRLAAQVTALAADEIYPTVAFEYEFYLLAVKNGDITPAKPLNGMPAARGEHYLNSDVYHDYQAFMHQVKDACRLQNIPVDAMMTESGDGQFEINLKHSGDVIKAAQDALLLKHAIKGVAQNMGMLASFMAKPFADQTGNGMHVHLSLYNGQANNLFAGSTGQEMLCHAVGGMLDLMPASMAVLAPNANSYRRFDPDMYVPISPCWGENNRRAAVRLPLSDDDNRRIEHRVAGADANPFLVALVLLAAIRHGIKEEISPPNKMGEFDAVPQGPLLPLRWHAANDIFKRNPVMEQAFGADFQRIYHTIRQYEEAEHHRQVSLYDLEHYLRIT